MSNSSAIVVRIDEGNDQTGKREMERACNEASIHLLLLLTLHSNRTIASILAT